MFITESSEISYLSLKAVKYGIYQQKQWDAISVTKNNEIEYLSKKAARYSIYHQKRWDTVFIAKRYKIQYLSTKGMRYIIYHRKLTLKLYIYIYIYIYIYYFKVSTITVILKTKNCIQWNKVQRNTFCGAYMIILLKSVKDFFLINNDNIFYDDSVSKRKKIMAVSRNVQES